MAQAAQAVGQPSGGSRPAAPPGSGVVRPVKRDVAAAGLRAGRRRLANAQRAHHAAALAQGALSACAVHQAVEVLPLVPVTASELQRVWLGWP